MQNCGVPGGTEDRTRAKFGLELSMNPPQCRRSEVIMNVPCDLPIVRLQWFRSRQGGRELDQVIELVADGIPHLRQDKTDQITLPIT